MCEDYKTDETGINLSRIGHKKKDQGNFANKGEVKAIPQYGFVTIFFIGKLYTILKDIV